MHSHSKAFRRKYHKWYDKHWGVRVERSYSLKAAERGGDDDDVSEFSPAELTCALGDAFHRAYLNMVEWGA